MIGLCLASGALSAFIAGSAFTLAWTHSIEKQRWEEDWRIEASADDALQLQLHLLEGRIHGSGAGMEPPDGARLEQGVWHYPVNLRLTQLSLAHSAYTAGYELCVDGHCTALSDRLPGLPALPEQPTSIALWGCRGEEPGQGGGAVED
ncbi:MAG: DUF1850 domain-containing protein [Rhodocyclaceae bacterium]